MRVNAMHAGWWIWQRLTKVPLGIPRRHFYGSALCVWRPNWESWGHKCHMLHLWYLGISCWMNVTSLTHSLILINTSYILLGPDKFCITKLRVPTASNYKAVSLPGKINEFLSSLLNTLTIAPFCFSPNLGKGEQFESLWGAVNQMPLAFQRVKEGAGVGKCLWTKKPWFQMPFSAL